MKTILMTVILGLLYGSVVLAGLDSESKLIKISSYICFYSGSIMLVLVLNLIKEI